LPRIIPHQRLKLNKFERFKLTFTSATSLISSRLIRGKYQLVTKLERNWRVDHRIAWWVEFLNNPTHRTYHALAYGVGNQTASPQTTRLIKRHAERRAKSLQPRLLWLSFLWKEGRLMRSSSCLSACLCVSPISTFEPCNQFPLVIRGQPNLDLLKCQP
jgi:hypothetical protein